jgi:hypothetical protein
MHGCMHMCAPYVGHAYYSVLMAYLLNLRIPKHAELQQVILWASTRGKPFPHIHTYIHITGPGRSMVYTAADPGSACPRAESPNFRSFFFLISTSQKGCFPPDRQKVSKFTL